MPPIPFGARVAMLAILVLAVRGAAADVPRTTNYQGLLLDSSNQPLTGTPDIFVRIWDDPVSSVPSDKLYEEVHLNVPTVDGVFSLVLGQGTLPSAAFDASLFAGPDRWLEIEVEGEILAPRQKLHTVAYSFQAQQCVDAQTLTGQTLGQVIAAARTGIAFTDLDGEAADGQIPAAISRDTEVFGLVLSNDGPGSGLNADLLDGFSSAQFLQVADFSFARIAGVASDAQIPASIARDAEVLGLVLAGDGAGSGLNADLLDSLSSSAFARTTGPVTLAGPVTIGDAATDGSLALREASGALRLRASATDDIVIGQGGTPSGDTDLAIRDPNHLVGGVATDGENALFFDASTSDLRLGSGTAADPGDDGDLLLENGAGLVTHSSGGATGDLLLGTSGVDGDVILRDTTGLSAITLDGSTGDLANKAEGEGLVKGWARIDFLGGIIGCYRCNTNAAATRRVSEGNYVVDFTFASDISARPQICTLNDGVAGGTSMRCFPDPFDPSAVRVDVLRGSTATDGGFTVVIY
jgi:hypothetical protein